MNEPMDKSWVTPLNDEDREYFAYFRTVCKRYNIDPSRANRLEYDFVTRVAESEFLFAKSCNLIYSPYKKRGAANGSASLLYFVIAAVPISRSAGS